MATSKEYELAVKIAAKIDPSFNTSLSKASKEVDSFGSKVASVSSKALKVGAAAASAFAGAAAAATVASVKNSIAFEGNMADVAKVVDGLRDSAGNLTDQYYDMKDSLLDLSTQIPMTAEQLTQIAAAAGQSGIARNEIVDFTESAGKMGIAFDTTADQAGDWMAKWRTSFKMSQKEVEGLADQINYLSNNSAANAVQLSSIVTEVGPLGKVAGMSAAQIAALGDTMVGVGVGEDVAATGIRKMATSMTAGASATAKQQAVLAQLGTSATDLATRMQTDAQGAILDFLGAVNKLPAAEQAAALKNYFGQESVGAIAPLLTNLEDLQKHFDMVGDASQYAGSMEDEYATRSATTGNSIELAKNALTRLSITYGDMFAPYVKIAADKAAEFLNTLNDMRPQMQAAFDWILANGPQIATTVASIGTAIGAVFAADKIGGLIDFKKLFSTKAAKSSVDNMLLQFGNAGKKIQGFGGSVSSYFGKVQGSVAKLNLGSAFKTMGDALGNTKIGGAVNGMFSGIAGKASGMVGGLKTALSSGVTQALGSIKGNGVAQGVSKMFTGAKGAITGTVGKVLSSPIGTGMTTAFSGLTSRLPALGGLFSTAFGPVTGIFSSLLTGALPIVAVVGSIIAVLSIFKDNIPGIREAISGTFGEQGVAVFDGFLATVQGVADKIKGFFSPENLAGIQDTITTMFGPEAGAAFGGLSTIIQSVMGVIQQLVTFAETYVKPIILNLWTLITTTILPGIMNAFTTAAPFISQIITGLGTAIMTVASMIGQAVLTVWPIIQGIISTIMNVVQVVAPALLAGVSAVVQGITGFISSLQTVFNGLITFITGVFTGNWSQAWEGVKQIFSGAFDALVNLCKTPINAVISIINNAISGINKLGVKIPDWVPVFGGKEFSINIPTIPTLATGGIATRATLAEIGEGGESEAVLPLSRLNDLLNANSQQQAKATAMTAISDAQSNAKPVPSLALAGNSGSQTQNIQENNPITYSPQIIIQGSANQADVENALRNSYEEFKKNYAQLQRDNRRTKY